MLGPVKHFRDELLKRDEVGVATGLAWTSVGGDILFVEALAVRGKGGLRLTGQLGDVMKESAQAAMSYARAHAAELEIPLDFFETHDVHIHVPEGAIPKDGPSAGITIATAMISAFTQRKVRKDVAMTGEITLRGEVLPIGGVKEKVLAARAAKITTIVLPKMNRRDVDPDLLPHPPRPHVPLRREHGGGPGDRAAASGARRRDGRRPGGHGAAGTRDPRDRRDRTEGARRASAVAGPPRP